MVKNKILSSLKEEFNEKIKRVKVEKLSINKDTKLELKNSSKLQIEITNNCNIVILNNTNQEIFNEIEIQIEEDIEVSITDFNNNENSMKKINTEIKKNSKLKFNQIIKKIKYYKNVVSLNENSNYELNSIFNCDNTTSCIINESDHLKENSISEMNINGISINGSKVICDGKVLIEEIAGNSSGHQKINAMILDKISSVQSEPILEIKNSNVSCSHGASVSKLSEDKLYYLNSKGIPDNMIIDMIVEGHKENIISKIPKLYQEDISKLI